MRYANGEIIFLVIGILIAIQLKNQNKKEKLMHYQKNHILYFKIVMANDTITFNATLKRIETSIEKIIGKTSHPHQVSLNPQLCNKTMIPKNHMKM